MNCPQCQQAMTVGAGGGQWECRACRVWMPKIDSHDPPFTLYHLYNLRFAVIAAMVALTIWALWYWWPL